MINTIVEGGICGQTWMPGAIVGMPCTFDAKRERARFSEPKATFRQILLHYLTEKGGDFRNPRYTFDTCVCVISRTRVDGQLRQRVRTRNYRVADLPDCEDLVAENDSAEFNGSDDE
jgi:hypothetical protein